MHRMRHAKPGCLPRLRPQLTRAALAIFLPFFSGCYNYKPELPETNAVPDPSVTPPRTSQPSKVTPQADESARKKEAKESENLVKETQVCVEQFPDNKGHKADQVRCIVTKTDAILDRTHPETTELRRAISAYAVQLAEREDRGEISHEQAENLFMQFVQQTPEAGMPPSDPPL